jgi:hypothetical protein
MRCLFVAAAGRDVRACDCKIIEHFPLLSRLAQVAGANPGEMETAFCAKNLSETRIKRERRRERLKIHPQREFGRTIVPWRWPSKLRAIFG